jgi:hypothetical protein
MATELITILDLDGLVLKAMLNLGYPDDEARVIKDIMMAAEVLCHTCSCYSQELS